MLPYLFLVASAVLLSVMSLLRKEYDRGSRGEGLAASFRFVILSFSATLLLAAILLGGGIATEKIFQSFETSAKYLSQFILYC